MKDKVIYVLLMMCSLVVCSQNVYQQTNVELKDAMDSDASYQCQATTSIRLMPGFNYKPVNGEKMLMEINRYSVFPPASGRYGSIEGVEGGVVGSLPGAFSVSNAGAAVYSIDIKLPNAIGKMKPKISLVYNNQMADGIMGWAWDVAGLSMIERVGQSEYHDGKVSDVNFIDDRFKLDGQRLMVVDGVYGGNGSVYKTEIDNVDKIVSYADDKNTKSFVIWRNDGTIWEYGVTDDSRLECSDNNAIIMKWLVNKVSDRDGNAIVFNYDKNVENGEVYIADVQYTYNDKIGLSPYYTVKFVYDRRVSDITRCYVNGNELSNTRILKSIEVHNNYTGKILYDYSLDYYEPGTYGRNDFIHYRLKSVGLSAGDDKLNPTRILWNAEKNHYPDDKDKFILHYLDKAVFSSVPFIGDFNGDGFSDVLTVPYKIQNTYAADVEGKVYLNNGDGTFQNTPMTTIKLSKNLEWIYVVDLDNDGIDDIVPYEFNYDADIYDDMLTTVRLCCLRNGKFVDEAIYRYKGNMVLLQGKFVTNDNNGLLLIDPNDSKENAHYITYGKNGEFVKNNISNAHLINGSDANFVVVDMTGDGLCELLVLMDDDYKVYKLCSEGSLFLDKFSEGTSLTKEVYTFPNDYNGDGKTDMLFYDRAGIWNIAFSKGNEFAEPKQCSDNVLRPLVLNSKDRYRYSLKELQNPSVTIRTADFDGDGTADVGVFKNMAGNYYLEIGFSPFIGTDERFDFLSQNRYYMPLNYSHQTIQIGRFLPQENVSILSGLPRNPMNTQKACISSLYPNSVFYSVERIVDGMGNVKGFSYDYLMQKHGAKDNFYNCSNSVMFNDIKTMSVPISALKSDTSYNVNNKAVVNRYEYRDALIHDKGHGFMGFSQVVSRRCIDDNVVEKIVKKFECSTLNEYGMPLPSSVDLYNGESQLVKKELFVFDNYVCAENDKVVMPLLVYSYNIEYNLDRQTDVKKITIMENGYLSDNAPSKTYHNYVNNYMNKRGVTDDVSVVEADACLYVEKKTTVCENDVDNWVINKPLRNFNVLYKGDGNEKIGGVDIYEYDDENPTRIVRETKIPNHKYDVTDSLSMMIEYEYDRYGNVIVQSMSSPSLAYKKVIKCEYGDEYKGMYKTKIIDELNREIKSVYDDDYGFLVSTVDYNNYNTSNEKDPFGIDDVVMLPDGMVENSSLRWTAGNEYSPPDASYYLWKKSTGNAESMVFYHSSGTELRTVTFDIDGKAIFVDKEYDDYGNLIKESLPYYENDVKYFVTFVYDKYNRMVEKINPNGVSCRIHYDGNEIVTDYLSPEGTFKTKKDVLNVMGLILRSEDAGGNEIIYDYYCDGLMKSATIAQNPKTKISFTYDNMRNKKSLYDPNYGLISYDYDALGNVKKIVTPKGDVIEMKYDELGRMVQRVETDNLLKKKSQIQWLYSQEKNKSGLLEKIVSDNHSVSYLYDDKLRLVKVTETVKGKEYSTSYNYDPANRIVSVSYPTGFCITKKFSNSGYEREVYDDYNNTLLWRTNETNSSGCVTEYVLGNGVVTNMLYDPKTCQLEGVVSRFGEKIIQDLWYKYDAWDNVICRSKKTDDYICEEFKYDEYDRLLEASLNGVKTLEMNYDYLGNVVDKKVGDVLVLYSTVYDKNRPNAILKAKTDAEDMFSGKTHNITYSLNDNLVSIQNGKDFLKIDYGYEHDRIYMETVAQGKMKSKIYVGDCEFVSENDYVKRITYIKGPVGVFAVGVLDDDGNHTISYLHKDNVGSWNVITDENAEVLQDVSFDAWGNVRDPDDLTMLYESPSLMYDRGFAGHEHLAGFGLINMNGRVYDPVMSMMLSPDNNIQQPQFSQNFNRYSYCLNNPLKYNDPTGESIESLVFGIVGGAINLIMNAENIDTFGEASMLFGVGFLKGFLAEYTMGQSWFLQLGSSTLMSGVTSGINQMVSVGDGSFKFSGDDWNSIKSAACYGLGNGLVRSFMYSYIVSPTAEQYAESLIESCRNRELAHAATSFVAHGMGCWFSGKPFLQTMNAKDIGFDMKMLGHLAKRLLVSYISESDFVKDAVDQRGKDIKDSMLKDILTEDPDHPDFEYISELKGVCIDRDRLYIVADIFALLPGEMLEIYPKPYLEEIISFPFNYSLFRTLFFNNQ